MTTHPTQSHSRVQVGRHAKITTDPPRKTPCVLWAGRYISCRWWEAFAPFYARMPLPFGRIRKDPFSGKGVLTSAFFWYLFFAEAKKSTQSCFPLQRQRKVQISEAMPVRKVHGKISDFKKLPPRLSHKIEKAPCGAFSINSIQMIHFFLLRKILLRNNKTFSATKKRMKMIIVKMGFTGANVAKNIIGNPSTIAGKF